MLLGSNSTYIKNPIIIEMFGLNEEVLFVRSFITVVLFSLVHSWSPCVLLTRV